MSIFSLLILAADLHDASRAEAAHGYDYTPFRSKAPPAAKARTTRARTALAAWLRANWPEYGRKVDNDWWAGPAHVSPSADPIVVSTLSLGCGGDGLCAHDGSSYSRSGSTAGPAHYQQMPLGGIVVDKRANPHAVYCAPILSLRSAQGTPDYRDEGGFVDDPAALAALTLASFSYLLDQTAADPRSLTRNEVARRAHPDAAHDSPEYRVAYDAHAATGAPGGMSHVGIVLYLAYWVRNGASVGVRTHVDAVSWIAGPRATEIERFTPRPFYPDDDQPEPMRGAPAWTHPATA